MLFRSRNKSWHRDGSRTEATPLIESDRKRSVKFMTTVDVNRKGSSEPRNTRFLYSLNSKAWTTPLYVDDFRTCFSPDKNVKVMVDTGANFSAINSRVV